MSSSDFADLPRSDCKGCSWRKPIKAVIGAVLTALIGAVLWAFFVVLLGYEFGVLSWVLGGLMGFVVANVVEYRGVVAQVIAALGAFGGIFIGKYFAFSYFLSDHLIQGMGETPGLLYGIPNPEQFVLFIESLPDLVTPWDALWMALALFTASGMTRG